MLFDYEAKQESGIHAKKSENCLSFTSSSC